jgi:hypothetical protein
MNTRAENRRFHYIYKITRFDGHYYIGLHSTDNLDDGYFGSGTRLAKSIAYHGREKHSKQILEFLPSRKAIKEREAQLVNESTLKDPLCMNLCRGGQGGDFTEEARRRIAKSKQGKTLSKEHRQKVSEALKGKAKPAGFSQKVSQTLTGKKLSEEHKKACAAGHHGKKLSDQHRKAQGDGRRGKPRSEEAKKKLSEYMKGKPNLSAKKLQKRCTVDGVTVYASVRDLVAVLGHGKNGVKSPNFRFME